MSRDEQVAATVCAICKQPAPAEEKHSCNVAGTTWTPGRPSGVPAYGKPEAASEAVVRFYVVTRAAHPGYCVVDQESGLVVLDDLTKVEAAIEAQFRNEADVG